VDDVLNLICIHAPDAILNAAGVVGKPNVDWCEKHQLETYYGNTHLPLMISDACQQQGVYLLHIGTGCVYYGYKNGGWLPDDYANPIATYTRTKYAADLVLSTMPMTGIARIRMPIDYIPHRANLIDKLASYTKVVDVENSATVIEDMQAVFLKLIKERARGIFHVTNPGSITHREILKWYNLYVDKNHSNEWITAEDLLDSGLALKTRSNNILNSENLEDYNIHMRPIRIAVEDIIKRYLKLK
jgi:dTDP-4-dehydrorhamnose reductase